MVGHDKNEAFQCGSVVLTTVLYSSVYSWWCL